ncbi:MAG: N-acetylmuramoyl-L-alanine amidase [Bacillota bacterium]|nr:N-acetylmuramoyl-L-alanine amidase [Bacillota bacterium]
MKKQLIFILIFILIFQFNIFAFELGRINIEGININSSPSLSSSKVETLFKNDYVTILDSSNEFYKIKAPSGRTGWIDSYFVNVDPPKYFTNTCGANANLRMSPTTSSKIIGQIKDGEKIKYIDTFHSWYIVEYEGMEAFVASWLGHISSDGSHNVHFLDEVINIRSSPSLNSEIIDQGYKYQNYKYLGEEYGWFKLGLENGSYGYAAGWLMSLDNNFYIDNILSFKTTTDNLRLRSGPSLEDEIITVMKKGTEVRVISEKNNWNKIVTWDGYVGFSHKDFLEDTLPLTGKKIVLNPGHGGKDPGAISATGKQEKDINLTVAFMVRNILNELGAEVIMTRDKDVYVNRVERAKMADRLGADIMFSIHHNSLNNSNYFGMSTYYDTKGNKNGKESSKLAESVYDSVVGINSIYRDGIYDRNFEVLRTTNVPAALIEIGFMSNSWEEENIHNHSFQQEVSRQIAFGILDYFRSH